MSGRRATQQYYHNTHRILLRCGKRPWRKRGRGMDRSDVLWTRWWHPNTSSSLVDHTRSGLSAPQQHRIQGQRLAERLGKLQFCGFFFLIGKFSTLNTTIRRGTFVCGMLTACCRTWHGGGTVWVHVNETAFKKFTKQLQPLFFFKTAMLCQDETW